MTKQILMVLGITLCMIGLFAGYGFSVLWIFRQVTLSSVLTIIIIVEITALAGTMLYVTRERIRELQEEEHDDLRQY